jgi:hypothetical protein
MPLHHTEVPALEKRGTKRRTKTARQNNWLTQRPQSARTQTSFSPKASKGSIAFGTQKSRARHCHHINFILAAAHFKSVNIRKRIARLFRRIVIVSQNYCAIFIALAQRIGSTSLIKVSPDGRYC